MFHPATLLLVWAGCALLVPFLPLAAAAAMTAAATLLALILAGTRTRLLFRRARWLLVSLFALFVFATPGVLLDGLAGRLGMTVEGLAAAFEHVARLVLLLATLALLHEHLGNRGFLSGLYWLMSPFAATWRDRVVVRLMLVVEFVEAGVSGGWRQWLAATPDGPGTLTLDTATPQARDWAVLALLAAGGLGVLWW